MRIFNFDTTYTELPDVFYEKRRPTPVKEPEMLIYNEAYARLLGLSQSLSKKRLAQVLSGNVIDEGAAPIAQAYAGHQYAHFTMLGDGRAVLLGEHITPSGLRLDVQLKGAGRTRYSRGGDGRAEIGSMLREYIISEAMHCLGIPTTRSLAVVKTGEKIIRETKVDGGILTRCASSHIRVGTFQYAAGLDDNTLVKQLADYTIKRHYPSCKDANNPYLELLRKVVSKQVELLDDWTRVGFVHGVMNTDNMAISGETIDYGPCAFIDDFHIEKVFSSIDHQGRYSYGNQPLIAGWNLARFSETLLSLIAKDQTKAIESVKPILSSFSTQYRERWLQTTGNKIGLKTTYSNDMPLIQSLFKIMQDNGFDYTNTFVYLRHTLNPIIGLDALDLLKQEHLDNAAFKAWLLSWQQTLKEKALSVAESCLQMERVNPLVIPRNQKVEDALQSVKKGDLTPFNSLLDALSKPYDYHRVIKAYIKVDPSDATYVTYCGT